MGNGHAGITVRRSEEHQEGGFLIENSKATASSRRAV